MHSYELEQNFLAALLQYPQKYFEVSSFISPSDFFSESSKVNKSIYHLVSQAIEGGETPDPVIILDRAQSMGLSFGEVDVGDYIQSLSYRKVNEDAIIDVAKNIKHLSVRRELHDSFLDSAKKVKAMSSSSSFDEIINAADKLYNSRVNLYEHGADFPINIYEELEETVEERGNNPVSEFGLMGPHERVNELYGSLLRPGNITTLVARSGVGKTAFCIDYVNKVSAKYDNLTVLHLDNGEMSMEEIMMRQCASFSGVPLNLLESGNWRKAGDAIVAKVRAVWKKVSKLKFYYYNVGGLDSDGMVNLVKRFYYSNVGRGNKMILSFDYIKTTAENPHNKSEWQVVGEMVDKFKRLVQKDICFNNEPCIAMITSVQSNRYGITTNRNSDSIVEDESVVSLSDRITQFSSHLFLLRQKTTDEIADEDGFGTHKLVCLKYRHLGENVHRAMTPVRMPNGDLKRNYINLNFENFGVSECGDLQDRVNSLNNVNFIDEEPEPGDMDL